MLLFAASSFEQKRRMLPSWLDVFVRLRTRGSGGGAEHTCHHHEQFGARPSESGPEERRVLLEVCFGLKRRDVIGVDRYKIGVGQNRGYPSEPSNVEL